MPLATLDEIRAAIGEEVGVSAWLTVDQARIDAFADATEDQQFIHVDPGGSRADAVRRHHRARLPVAVAAVAHGRPKRCCFPRALKMAVNYGFDRVRFLAPVKSGKRVRGRFTLDSVEEKAPGQLLLRHTVTVEIEGEDKPALTAVVARPDVRLRRIEWPRRRDRFDRPHRRSARPIAARSTRRPSPTLGAHPIRAAIERAEGRPGRNRRRHHGRRAPAGRADDHRPHGRASRRPSGRPSSGMSIDRQCASGLMAIATAAKQVIVDRMDVVVAGGVESISLVQTRRDAARARPGAARACTTHVYMPMIETAEIVAKRYGISRERCDEYALRSQQRTAAAQADGRFDDEIVPVTATMAVKDKETGEVSMQEVTLDKDEGNRADTTLEGLAELEPVRGPDTIDHRRQCQPALRRRLGLAS